MKTKKQIEDMEAEYWKILDKTKNKIERERLASMIMILQWVLK
jgi:hypothetical protein